MSVSTQAYHLIHVEDAEGERSYYLDAVTLSIGRDSSNAIVLDDPLVSRQHALLIRVPTQDNQYQYELVDGNIKGQRSTNGFQVNHQACFKRVLATGDRIQIGAAKIFYLIAHLTPADYAAYFETQTISFQRLKDEFLDATSSSMTELAA